MVKYSKGDTNLGPIMSVLAELCYPHHGSSTELSSSGVDTHWKSHENTPSSFRSNVSHTTSILDNFLQKEYNTMAQLGRLLISLESMCY
jgi:hypothetical protein